jgi:hypothetical protein
MDSVKCDYVSLNVCATTTLDNAAFEISFSNDDHCKAFGVPLKTKFHAYSTPNMLEISTSTGVPMYKAAGGALIMASMLNEAGDDLDAAPKTMQRWAFILNCKTWMTTDWVPLALMESDVCPHCVFSCPCICGTMKWLHDTEVTTFAKHSAPSAVVSDAHMKEALTARWGFIQDVEFKIIDIADGSKKNKADSRAYCNGMAANQIEQYSRHIVIQLAKTCSSKVQCENIILLMNAMTESEVKRVFEAQQGPTKIPKIKLFFMQSIKDGDLKSKLQPQVGDNVDDFLVSFQKNLQRFWDGKKVASSMLASRLNAATEQLRREGSRITHVINKLLAMPKFGSEADCIKEQGLINNASICIHDVTKTMIACDKKLSKEYEIVLKESTAKLAEASDYITAAENHRESFKVAAAEAAAAAAAEAAAKVAAEKKRISDAVARLQSTWMMHNEEDRLKESQYVANILQLLVGSTNKNGSNNKKGSNTKKNRGPSNIQAANIQAANIQAAAACLLQAEQFRAAAMERRAVPTLQARVRAALLLHRIEAMRRAAELLATTRYELRTLARLRNDDECGVCFARFDYHEKMPMTGPCSPTIQHKYAPRQKQAFEYGCADGSGQGSRSIWNPDHLV